MKNLIKIFLLILIPLVGVLILSYPGVWKYRVENILNRKILKDSGWELSIGDLSGHLLKEVESKNIEITHENGTKIFVPALTSQIDVLKSITGKVHLKVLNIYNFEFQQPNQNTEKDKIFILPDLDYNKFPLSINKLTFDGTLAISLPDTNHLIDLNVLSSIIPDETGLNINIDSLYVKHQAVDIPFTLNGTKVNIHNRIVSINPISGSIEDVLLDGQLTFTQTDEQQLNGNINVKNLVVPDNLFKDSPVQVNFSKINSNFRFDTDFINYSGLINVKNDLGLDMTGDFNVTNIDDRWIAQQVILQSKKARLFVHGDFTKGKEINADLNLEKLDLSEWITKQKSTNISGIAKLNMSINEESINSVSLDLKTSESALYKNDTIFVDGAFVYENNRIDIANPLTIAVGPSSITSTGTIDFTHEVVDLELILQDMDVFLINNFWEDDSLDNGTISGNFIASGEFKNPKVNGELRGREIRYKDFYLSEIEVEGYRDQKGDSLGFAKVKLGSGNWRNIDFAEGTVEAVFLNTETHFTDINIVNGDEYLIGIGKLDNKNTFYIDNIRSFYDNHYFVNTNPFYISYKDNHISISPFIAHFDDGVIEGELDYDESIFGSIRFTNIGAELLHPFIENDKHKFTGTMFGDIIFDENEGKQNYLLDMSIKDGAFAKEPFEQLQATMNYGDDVLTINNLTLQENEKSKVDVSGMIPLGGSKENKKIQLKSNFQNTNFKTITQFTPDWLEMSGRLTGELNIDGTGYNMNSNFAGTIQNAIFDKIQLGTVQCRGDFDGKKLTLQSFSSDLNDDHYTGFGYVPIDLNILSDTFGKFKGQEPIYLLAEGKGSNIDFITNYFDEIDRAVGDYTVVFELSGIWDNIIRNGRINANNVTITTPLLDDPILGVHGLVNIDDNQLVIDNLQGKMYRAGRRASKKPDNISISGSIDMTSFFEPYLNISTIGKEAYFRSLIFEIEGITDFNINITGRDTVLFSGEVAPIDVVLFQALTTSELGILPSEEGSTIVHYKIDFPIKGKFALTNDQIDAVLIGDVSINQFGEREPDFAGELIIEEGKFYYYRDVFKITEGYLTFDNRGFNPYMDISANTTIDGERIDINIIGQLDNPTLTFTSENNFSQSDILELLTWRKRFEEQEITSTEIGTQATDMVFAWFGNQLDRNILELSGLDRLGILENVDVRGTTGLITAEEDFSISAPLTDNVAINYAYRRSFGLTDAQHALGVELRLTRNLSLVGNIDRSGYMHIKYRLRYAY